MSPAANPYVCTGQFQSLNQSSAEMHGCLQWVVSRHLDGLEKVQMSDRYRPETDVCSYGLGGPFSLPIRAV